MGKVNLKEKFALFTAHWSPKIVGELNGQQVKLVKFQGHSSGITTRRKTSCFWWSEAAFGWSSATVTFRWKKVNS